MIKVTVGAKTVLCVMSVLIFCSCNYIDKKECQVEIYRAIELEKKKQLQELSAIILPMYKKMAFAEYNENPNSISELLAPLFGLYDKHAED